MIILTKVKDSVTSAAKKKTVIYTSVKFGEFHFGDLKGQLSR